MSSLYIAPFLGHAQHNVCICHTLHACTHTHTHTHAHTQHTQADSDISLDGLAQVKAITLYTDDKKSLGFNIEKGEIVGTAPSVLISSLTPGGPAELSNSLQVGDHILSVDGQKILGYAYEKVECVLSLTQSVVVVHCEQIN